MKRNIFSVLLVCLMIVSVCVLSGCKTDELEAQINENASAAEGAVSDAISKAEGDVNAAAKQAAADLAAAQEELEKLIADGNAADADALDAAVDSFNAAIAAAEEAIAAIEEACADSDAAMADELADLESELTTAIEDATQAVAAAAAQNLAAVKAELLAAIADKSYATSTELTEAVAEAVEGLSALIATVQKADMSYADSLKAELDAKFAAAMDEAAKAASKDLEDATALLKALIAEKADITAVNAADAALKVEIDALVAVLEALTGDDYADLAELGNLKAYVAAEIAKAKAASDVAYLVMSDWNAATEAFVAAVEAVATKYYSTNRDLYYAADLVALDVAYEVSVAALSRCTNAADVATELADALAALEAVDTKAEAIYADLTAKGDKVADVVRNAEWNAIITAAEEAIAAETDAAVVESLADVKALAEEFRARYEALASNETWANAINADVEALIAAIEANGFTAANKAEYAAIKAEIAEWDEATGAANVALINRDNVAALDADYAAAVAAYETAANTVKAALAAFTGEYVYNYNADLAAINKAAADYTAWTADVAARGFDLTGDLEKAVADVYAAFNAGAYARAQALEQANADATALETRIAKLSAELTELTVVRSRYQTELLSIKADAAKWINTYFADAYAAEAVAGNTNYELLDHAAIVALEELYNTQMAEVMALAENLKAALAKLGTISIYSGADLDAASAAYTAFTNWLVDLKYEIEGLDDAAGITNTLTTKTVAYKDIVDAALAAYPAVDSPADVKLSSADDIDALVEWYEKYFNVDVNAADSALIADVTLDATHVVNAAALADAKAAVAAFAELTAAKKAEFDALKAEIEALVAKKPSTALREAVNTALANYKAWIEGAGAPDTYLAAQFVPVDADVAALADLKVALDKLDADVKIRELRVVSLIARIEALVVDYTKLDTAALQTEAQNVLNTLNKDIEIFTNTHNDGVDCFADYADTLKAAQTAINQAKNLSTLTSWYNNLKNAIVNNVADVNVQKSLLTRAASAFENGKASIAANYTEGYDLAIANFNLISTTAFQYKNAIAKADTAEKLAKVYEAYVLLDNRADMEKASQLNDEINVVVETFAAVLV